MYLLQTGVSSLTLFVTLILLRSQHLVVIASLGATAFICFAMPKSRAAHLANTVGGHAIGLLAGVAWSFIPHHGPPIAAAIYAAAVGTTILFMLLTGYKHPPAAGTALGIAVAGPSAGAVFAVMASVVAFSLARIVLLTLLYDQPVDD